MPENKIVNFKAYDTLVLFERDLSGGVINESSIVFIKDKKLIWARGGYYSDIPDSYTKLEIDELLNNLTSSQIVSLTGYIKAEKSANILESDTLNIALGKLERIIEDNELVVSASLNEIYDKLDEQQSSSNPPSDGSLYGKKDGVWSLVPDEVLISDGIEPIGDEKIWIDLSEDSPTTVGSVSSYIFNPTISSNKISQSDYNGLVDAIDKGNIIYRNYDSGLKICDVWRKSDGSMIRLVYKVGGGEYTIYEDNISSDLTISIDSYIVPSKTYVDDSISQQVSSVFRVRGSVANYESLPSSDVKVGDVYTLLDNGSEYVATSSDPITWEYLGEKITINDATTESKGLMTTQQVQDLIDVKAALVGVDESLTQLEALVK